MEEKLRNYFGNEWYEALGDYLKSPEFLNIGRQVTKARETNIVYPEKELTFRAFKETPYNEVNVVILALDPYSHNVADGLAFSCSRSLHPQPSLKNILIEINNEYPENYFDISNWRLDAIDLQRWAKAGVLLLNAYLTVEDKKPTSHAAIWTPFTIKVIEALNKKDDVVYLLMGKSAQSFEKYISTRHRIVSCPHPAAEVYSGGKAGFFGSNCFKQVNECLESVNLQKINW